MDEAWCPPLQVRERDGLCHLVLVGVARGRGESLQDAGDDLVLNLLNLVAAFRATGLRIASELGPPDLGVSGFLAELSEIAARGGDIRERVFGLQPRIAA
jgi:hypothetical protein